MSKSSTKARIEQLKDWLSYMKIKSKDTGYSRSAAPRKR